MPANHYRPIRAPADGSPMVRHHHHLALLLLVFLTASSCARAQSSPPDNYVGYGYGGVSSLNASTALVICLILAPVLLFTVFFFLYFRYCSLFGSATNTNAGAAVLLSRSRRVSSARVGLDKELITSFPRLAYSDVKDLKVGEGALECAVCLCEFEDGDHLMLLPGCRHVFHSDCVGTWLEAHVTCPVCRLNLAAAAVLPEPQLVAEGDGPGDRTTDRVEIAVREEDDVSDHEADAADLARIGSRKRDARATREGEGQARTRAPIPRSALEREAAMREGEGQERYTLRLPDEAIAAVVAVGLRRTTSFSAPRGGNEGEGWGGRLAGALVRTFSTKFPSRRRMEVGNGEGEGSGRAGSMLTAIRRPLDCFTGGGEGGEKSIAVSGSAGANESDGTPITHV